MDLRLFVIILERIILITHLFIPLCNFYVCDKSTSVIIIVKILPRNKNDIWIDVESNNL